MASPDTQEKEKVLDLIEEGRNRLWRWRASGFPDLEGLFSRNCRRRDAHSRR
jgi:hypothetical protein